MVKETNKETDTAPKVYQAMSAVQAEISSLGISKSRKNVQQGYAFRALMKSTIRWPLSSRNTNS